MQSLIKTLESAIGALELTASNPLRQEFETLCQKRSQDCRVAVFAPFNYGKSTLLNAILGERALPIDLIPTTGAAIRVRYGEILQTSIQLNNDSTMTEAGTDLLKQFAILDDDRRMRDDVKAVEVFCPHPLLKTGVEFLDLPGTNDREAQDTLVKTQLLTADVIIQVLDGRTLMTLGEREQLREWLLDRGITTVIFVVNFLNLLEPEDQKHVYNRLRFVAENFRADLPQGVSNLYRVDALPALRARLQGDSSAAQQSGLPMFESALQTIATHHQQSRNHQRTRMNAIVLQTQQKLRQQIDLITLEIETQTTSQNQRLQIQQKAQKLIQKGFESSIKEFQEWLRLDRLLMNYQTDAIAALQSNSFRTWETGGFKRTAIDHQQAIVKWVHQACEFFALDRPHQLLVTFPALSQEIEVASLDHASLDHASFRDTFTSTFWKSAAYLLDLALPSKAESDSQQRLQLCRDLSHSYFEHFSRLNLAAIEQYEQSAKQILYTDVKAIPQAETSEHYRLQLLRSRLNALIEIKEL